MKEEEFEGEIYCNNCKSKKKQSILRINALYGKKDKQVIFGCNTCEFVNVHFMDDEFCGVFE